MFSSRLPPALAPNALARAAAALAAQDVRLLDLTESNPTRVGLRYPEELLAPLGESSGLIYAPEPFGILAARQAVARHLAGSHGVSVDPAHVVLSASTSEAYSWIFKLLCDPGDEVLVPAPGYPLFDSLASLEAVRLTSYPLDYHGVWSIDRERMLARLGPRTRAILVVSPNNPTGSCLRAADRDWLLDVAAARGTALISDEVFAEYPLRPAADAASLLSAAQALTFVLGGLSKTAGLPQVKLAWTTVSGPSAMLADALGRLEIIADTYLSVSTPVQCAAGHLLSASRPVRAAILDRLRANLATLGDLCAETPAVTLLRPEGGWSAVLRLPATEPEETLALRLLEVDHVRVHPGYFFDFDNEAWLVLSLLVEPAIFAEATRRILARVATASTP